MPGQPGIITNIRLELRKQRSLFIHGILLLILGTGMVFGVFSVMGLWNTKEAAKITFAGASILFLAIFAALFGTQCGAGLRREPERMAEEMLPAHPDRKFWAAYLVGLAYYGFFAVLLIALFRTTWQQFPGLDTPTSGLSFIILVLLQLHFRSAVFSYWTKQTFLGLGFALFFFGGDILFIRLLSGYQNSSSYYTFINAFWNYGGLFIISPLLVYEKIMGILYFDTSDSGVCFDEDHLHLMTAIGNVAAIALENIRHVEWLQAERVRLQQDLDLEHNMIGESDAIRKVVHFIARVAPTDSTVLILGESGTGKELAARAVHQNSQRSQRAFVAINSASLSETLLESELFGHEKGAFTGAVSQKKGKMEIADKGTLFLDEIAEVPTPIQARLLRVLQHQEFERVGGTQSIHVDVRLIAATNRNLENAIKDGLFREDLYYRLNVIQLTMPPLRERKQDILLLATYFAAKFAKKTRRRPVGISPEAKSCLLNYSWPGNIRELENVIERAVVLGTTDTILPEDLPEIILESQTAGHHSTSYHEAVKEAKRQIIMKAIQQTKGNYSEAARLMGIHPNNLHRIIRDLDLKPLLKIET